VFYDENILVGRSRLFEAMKQGTLDAVQKVSSAPWTLDEIRRVWNQRKDTGAQLRDQDHISLLMYSNPVIPGRPEFMSGQSSVNPVDDMVHTAQALTDAGVSALCIVCSTAHYFKEQMLLKVENAPVFLDMIELTIQTIIRNNPNGDIIVGLLGTEPLLKYGIYESAREHTTGAERLKIVTPVSIINGDQSNFTEAIFGPTGVKAGFDHDLNDPDTFHNFELLMEEVLKMQKLGAVSIILGCTELPLLLTPENISKFGNRLFTTHSKEDLAGISFVNPSQILADTIIHLSLVSKIAI